MKWSIIQRDKIWNPVTQQVDETVIADLIETEQDARRLLDMLLKTKTGKDAEAEGYTFYVKEQCENKDLARRIAES